MGDNADLVAIIEKMGVTRKEAEEVIALLTDPERLDDFHDAMTDIFERLDSDG